MQSVQFPWLQDASPSLAAALATLIDRRARVGLEAGHQGSGPDGSVLIWLDFPMLGCVQADKGGRGVIVVSHNVSQAVGTRSFVVSFPNASGGEGRQLGTVSGLLAAMGWSLVASKRRKTEQCDADTAVLDDTSLFGNAQRMWLAEPVEAPSTPRHAPTYQSPRPAAWLDASSTTTA